MFRCCSRGQRERFNDAVEAIVIKLPVEPPLCCCGCCSAFRPRYKKLVDNIYPANPEDGLVKANMDKLIYYAMHYPDKLDRIGEYLAHRLNRDTNRRRTGYVIISMDALDQLLVSCHANTLNLFVESFLHMIQKLLESSEPKLQLRATMSFEKFAAIREDTPSYHRRYDFLVSKFSSMCYSNEDDNATRSQLRTAGIKGLQGVVRKTDWDNLGENIWLPTHMDKIVPALLFNMQESTTIRMDKSNLEGDHETDGPKEPHELAEMCLRELVSRATYGKIHHIVKPLLWHLDHHDLWVMNDFAVQSFRILMYSIQVQYSITVIELLMAHMNEKSNAPPQVRTGIADVLSKVIPIAAGECIGPAVIEIINSLLEHIRKSVVEGSQEAGSSEQTYQETLIHALGEYANHLPDYQKIDSMVFILNKVPGSDRVDDTIERPDGEVKLQHLLLKALLRVGTKYTAVQYNVTFSQSFLVRLMRLSVSADNQVRLTVQQILHTLIDRHSNVEKLTRPVLDVSRLGVMISKPSRQDVSFWKKSGGEILLSLQENCEFNNNTVTNLTAVYTTIMLILSEIRTDDTLVDVIRVLLHVQGVAIDGPLSMVLRIQLHVLVSALMMVISQHIPALKEHVTKVVKKRSDVAPHLLPELKEHYAPNLSPDNLPDDLLFDNQVVIDVLTSSNLDEKRLNASVSSMMRRQSTVGGAHSSSSNVTDHQTISVEVDSACSSPGLPRKLLEEEITFEALKKVLTESPELKRKAEEERRRQITQAFMTESFEALVAKIQAKQPDTLQNKLNEIFNRLPATNQPTSTTSLGFGCEPSLGVVSPTSTYQLPFPDIYIY